MDAWKGIYPTQNLSVSFEENKALKIHKFYLMIDGVKNENNFIEYDEFEESLKLVN